jgi:nickel transport protein
MASVAWGHGVQSSVEERPAVVVRFAYTTGEPLSYAQAEVFSPKDDELEYQNGRLDAGGRFAFVPDGPGSWRVKVSDGMGHHSVRTIAVSAPAGPDQAPDRAPDQPLDRADGESPVRGATVLLGLSLTANLWCLISAAIKRRRRPAKG